MKRWLGVAFLISLMPGGSALWVARAAEPAAQTALPTSEGAPSTTQGAIVHWDLPTVLKMVPPLTHDATGRLPLICIEVFRMTQDDKSFDQGKPLSPEMIRAIKARGFTQYITPDAKYIPYAKALQKEGAGVVMFQGLAFNGPPDDVPASMHVLPADYKGLERPTQQPKFPCPLVLDGWIKKQTEWRALFKQYKAAGVKLDAAWLDWEIEPLAGKAEWDEAAHCSRCRAQFPPGVLDDKQRYYDFIELWRIHLFSTYLVAPILESYPGISVTNWEAVTSTVKHPTISWSGSRKFAGRDLGLFTASNPVAYGDTAWYSEDWKKEWNWPLDVAHMDRLYTQVMLGEISDDAANRQRVAPEAGCVPWVDRFCADDRDPKIPILSRERYREILRHIWLRGAQSMQVFNPIWFSDDPDKMRITIEEVQDVVSVYDEMLAFRPFLDEGRVMNTQAPAATEEGPIWSGLRLKDQALVRTFTQAGAPCNVKIKPFDGPGEVELSCPPAGATYLLTRSGAEIKVSRQ